MGIKLAEGNARYERLRYVTENFQSLQGLTLVWCGGVLVFLKVEDIPGVVFPWWLKLLSCGLFLAAFRYIPNIPEYYERRFGSVESSVSPPDAILTLVFLVMLLVMIFFGPAAGRYLDSVIPEVSNGAHRMISDPDHRANLHPVLLLFAFLCARALGGMPRRLRRMRILLYCACLLLWTGVLTFLPIRHPEAAQQTHWRILNSCWFGITLMMWGLYDHLTLVNLLPRRDQTDENE